MKEIISKAASSGLDFTRGSAIKSFLSRLDMDPEGYDVVYTAIKNMAFEKEFKRTPCSNRLVFLPQCLRNSKECVAELTEDGYECKKCGKCSIGEIVEEAERLGYKGVYIVPGASLVKKIIKRERPAAVVGVACYLELVETMDQVALMGTIPQGIHLLKDGCVDTKVSIDKVIEILNKQ